MTLDSRNEDPDIRLVVERLQRQLSADLAAMRERTDWTEQELETAAGVAPGSVRAAVLNLATVASLAYTMGFLVDVRFCRPTCARPR